MSAFGGDTVQTLGGVLLPRAEETMVRRQARSVGWKGPAVLGRMWLFICQLVNLGPLLTILSL